METHITETYGPRYAVSLFFFLDSYAYYYCKVFAHGLLTFNSRRAESGRMTGLKERECGQIGVNNIHGTFGCT